VIARIADIAVTGRIAKAIGSQSLFRASAGRCKDRQQLVGFGLHIHQLLRSHETAFRENLKPKHSFVCFFDDHSDLSHKFGFRA